MRNVPSQRDEPGRHQNWNRPGRSSQGLINKFYQGAIKVRNEEYELVFEEDIDNSQVYLHVILTNVEVTPDGPQESPVPTGFEHPNGAEQPFIHLMFGELDISPAVSVNHSK